MPQLTTEQLREELDALQKRTGATRSKLRSLLEPARAKKGKGSSFERDVCKHLSLWWTGSEEDDVFWRSQASGARATQRTKAGMRTKGQYGDVAAVDERGQPLMEQLVIELKRGYNNDGLGDILDGTTGYLAFWQQLQAAKEEAGVPCSLLITKRDRKETICCLDTDLWAWVKPHFATKPSPFARLHIDGCGDIICMRYSDFLWAVPPSHLGSPYAC